ncbi:unnamed protein product [Amoebophrya sp. A120]|nr:unnamed protein product [Amoebophrya sp. A120]|eukprot:GSA120T00010686001.1
MWGLTGPRHCTTSRSAAVLGRSPAKTRGPPGLASASPQSKLSSHNSRQRGDKKAQAAGGSPPAKLMSDGTATGRKRIQSASPSSGHSTTSPGKVRPKGMNKTKTASPRSVLGSASAAGNRRSRSSATTKSGSSKKRKSSPLVSADGIRRSRRSSSSIAGSSAKKVPSSTAAAGTTATTPGSKGARLRTRPQSSGAKAKAPSPRAIGSDMMPVPRPMPSSPLPVPGKGRLMLARSASAGAPFSRVISAEGERAAAESLVMEAGVEEEEAGEVEGAGATSSKQKPASRRLSIKADNKTRTSGVVTITAPKTATEAKDEKTQQASELYEHVEFMKNKYLPVEERKILDDYLHMMRSEFREQFLHMYNTKSKSLTAVEKKLEKAVDRHEFLVRSHTWEKENLEYTAQERLNKQMETMEETFKEQMERLKQQKLDNREFTEAENKLLRQEVNALKLELQDAGAAFEEQVTAREEVEKRMKMVFDDLQKQQDMLLSTENFFGDIEPDVGGLDLGDLEKKNETTTRTSSKRASTATGSVKFVNEGSAADSNVVEADGKQDANKPPSATEIEGSDQAHQRTSANKALLPPRLRISSKQNADSVQTRMKKFDNLLKETEQKEQLIKEMEANYTKTILDLKQSHEFLQQKVKQMLSEKKKQRKKVEDFLQNKEKLQFVEEEYDKLKKEHEELLTKNLSAQQQKLKMEGDRLRVEVNQLHSVLQNSKVDNENLVFEKTKLEQENARLFGKVSGYEAEIERLNAELSSRDTDIRQVQELLFTGTTTATTTATATTTGVQVLGHSGRATNLSQPSVQQKKKPKLASNIIKSPNEKSVGSSDGIPVPATFDIESPPGVRGGGVVVASSPGRASPAASTTSPSSDIHNSVKNLIQQRKKEREDREKEKARFEKALKAHESEKTALHSKLKEHEETNEFLQSRLDQAAVGMVPPEWKQSVVRQSVTLQKISKVGGYAEFHSRLEKEKMKAEHELEKGRRGLTAEEEIRPPPEQAAEQGTEQAANKTPASQHHFLGHTSAGISASASKFGSHSLHSHPEQAHHRSLGGAFDQVAEDRADVAHEMKEEPHTKHLRAPHAEGERSELVVQQAVAGTTAGKALIFEEGVDEAGDEGHQKALTKDAGTPSPSILSRVAMFDKEHKDMINSTLVRTSKETGKRSTSTDKTNANVEASSVTSRRRSSRSSGGMGIVQKMKGKQGSTPTASRSVSPVEHPVVEQARPENTAADGGNKNQDDQDLIATGAYLQVVGERTNKLKFAPLEGNILAQQQAEVAFAEKQRLQQNQAASSTTSDAAPKKKMKRMVRVVKRRSTKSQVADENVDKTSAPPPDPVLDSIVKKSTVERLLASAPPPDEQADVVDDSFIIVDGEQEDEKPTETEEQVNGEDVVMDITEAAVNTATASSGSATLSRKSIAAAKTQAASSMFARRPSRYMLMQTFMRWKIRHHMGQGSSTAFESPVSKAKSASASVAHENTPHAKEIAAAKAAPVANKIRRLESGKTKTKTSSSLFSSKTGPVSTSVPGGERAAAVASEEQAAASTSGLVVSPHADEHQVGTEGAPAPEPREKNSVLDRKEVSGGTVKAHAATVASAQAQQERSPTSPSQTTDVDVSSGFRTTSNKQQGKTKAKKVKAEGSQVPRTAQPPEHDVRFSSGSSEGDHDEHKSDLVLAAHSLLTAGAKQWNATGAGGIVKNVGGGSKIKRVLSSKKSSKDESSVRSEDTTTSGAEVVGSRAAAEGDIKSDKGKTKVQKSTKETPQHNDVVYSDADETPGSTRKLVFDLQQDPDSLHEEDLAQIEQAVYTLQHSPDTKMVSVKATSTSSSKSPPSSSTGPTGAMTTTLDAGDDAAGHKNAATKKEKDENLKNKKKNAHTSPTSPGAVADSLGKHVKLHARRLEHADKLQEDMKDREAEKEEKQKLQEQYEKEHKQKYRAKYAAIGAEHIGREYYGNSNKSGSSSSSSDNEAEIMKAFLQDQVQEEREKEDRSHEDVLINLADARARMHELRSEVAASMKSNNLLATAPAVKKKKKSSKTTTSSSPETSSPAKNYKTRDSEVAAVSGSAVETASMGRAGAEGAIPQTASSRSSKSNKRESTSAFSKVRKSELKLNTLLNKNLAKTTSLDDHRVGSGVIAAADGRTASKEKDSPSRSPSASSRSKNKDSLNISSSSQQTSSSGKVDEKGLTAASSTIRPPIIMSTIDKIRLEDMRNTGKKSSPSSNASSRMSKRVSFGVDMVSEDSLFDVAQKSVLRKEERKERKQARRSASGAANSSEDHGGGGPAGRATTSPPSNDSSAAAAAQNLLKPSKSRGSSYFEPSSRLPLGGSNSSSGTTSSPSAKEGVVRDKLQKKKEKKEARRSARAASTSSPPASVSPPTSTTMYSFYNDMTYDVLEDDGGDPHFYLQGNNSSAAGQRQRDLVGVSSAALPREFQLYGYGDELLHDQDNFPARLILEAKASNEGQQDAPDESALHFPDRIDLSMLQQLLGSATAEDDA